MLKIVLLVLLAEVFTAVGQVMLKAGANNTGAYNLRDPLHNIRFIKDALSQPVLWAGLFAMGLGLAVWVIALAQGDLSLVFSLGSMQYVIILFAAHFFLGEKIDRMKALGTFLVIFGIILITLS